MPRQPLPVGAWGKISRREDAPGRWTASCRFRDYDGTTRKVTATGKTGAAAERSLVASLRERATPSTTDITQDTRLHVVAERWFQELDDRPRAPRTVQRYREVLDTYVLPGVGGLQVREATVSALDRFIRATASHKGAATAKLCRTVLFGVLGLAVRHGAAQANPVRDVPAPRVEHREVTALDTAQIGLLQELLTSYDSTPAGGAARVQLADVAGLMLATGCRVGEALAVRWDDVDLGTTPPTVAINGTVIRLKAGGLVRQDHRKSAGSGSRYLLPGWAVDMLMRRRVAVVESNPWGLVFPSTVGTLQDPTNYRKAWRKALAGSELAEVTPHVLRKTVGTLVARSGGVAAASAQLGHSSERVTSAHYVERLKVAPDATAALAGLWSTGGAA